MLAVVVVAMVVAMVKEREGLKEATGVSGVGSGLDVIWFIINKSLSCIAWGRVNEFGEMVELGIMEFTADLT